ncbi:MAG: ribosome maturation factor RimP [Syntrophus sp. (in: bacteria)]|nr:ribosome maturation factor RimP [Syntrophus sp. (in: bacteria)]
MACIIYCNKFHSVLKNSVQVGSARFFSLNRMLSDKVIIEKISNVLAPILEDARLELVEIEFKPIGKRWLLRIYIEKEGGLTIADCVYVSRELSRILDVEDVIEYAYTLEVSSPGLTRPLKKMEDFARHKGKTCRIITQEAVAGKNEFRGEITDVSSDKVEIKEKIDIITIPICAIKKAHLEFEL